MQISIGGRVGRASSQRCVRRESTHLQALTQTTKKRCSRTQRIALMAIIMVINVQQSRMTNSRAGGDRTVGNVRLLHKRPAENRTQNARVNDKVDTQ